jgi:hypothetical protein
MKQEERKKPKSDSVRQVQRKITSTWKLIPEHEQRQLMKEEETGRRMELREAKVNMWKRWRKEADEKKTETEETNKSNQEKWLNKLEETVTRLKKEVEEKKRAKALYEERRSRLLEENKKKQEKLLKKEQEKKERKLNKKMLEERWAMARWITHYIDENSDRWKEERNVRQEKIRVIKERLEENKTVKISIRPAKLQKMTERGQAEHQPSTETDNDCQDSLSDNRAEPQPRQLYNQISLCHF